MPEADGYASVEHGRLFYERTGSGNAIVWLHGGFLDRRMWEPQFGHFARRYDLLRYDQRGFGRSDPPKAEYAESFDLRHLLDEVGVASGYLVGLATGARIALDFAATMPNRVDGLVLIAPTIEGYVLQGPEEERLWEELDRREEGIEKLAASLGPERAIEAKVGAWAPNLDEATRAKVVGIALENRARALGEPNRFRQKLTPRTIDRLGAVRSPTLIVTSERDFAGFGAIAAYLQARLPLAQSVVLAGADHLANLSQPPPFNDLLEGFFARLDFIAMLRGSTR